MNAKMREKCLKSYKEHWLEHGRAPASIYRFCKDNGVKESVFFKTFASFEVLEGHLWLTWFEEARAVVEKEPDFAEQSARQRMLAIYFTFIEILQEERSFFLLRWPKQTCPSPCKRLSRMKSAFESFAREAAAKGEAEGEIASRGKPTEWFPRISSLHLGFILTFYAKDDSEGFQRTDAFIEKSVRLLFDAAAEQVIDSAFDLVRFLAGKSHV
jgi:hypothetical protein